MTIKQASLVLLNIVLDLARSTAVCSEELSDLQGVSSEGKATLVMLCQHGITSHTYFAASALRQYWRTGEVSNFRTAMEQAELAATVDLFVEAAVEALTKLKADLLQCK